MKGGSIFKQGNKWIYKGTPYQENGKTKRERKSLNNLEQAEAYRDSIIRNYNLKVNKPTEHLTVLKAYERWQKIAWENEALLSYNTQRGYVSIFKKHIIPYIGENYIENLNTHPFYLHLKDLVEEGLTQKTINNIKQALVALLNFAEENEWIKINNANNIHKVKAKKRNRDKIVNVISQSEYELVYNYLKNVNSHYAEIIRFLRWSGFRTEELCIKDKDIREKYITTKSAYKLKYNVETDKLETVIADRLKSSAAWRSIPMNKELKDCLITFNQLKKEKNIKSEYVFCSSAGTPLIHRSILRAFHSALTHCGLEKRGLHSLRKLYCKTLKQAIDDWEKIRRIMGHESVEVTQRYYYDVDTDDIIEYSDSLDQIIDQINKTTK